jgi:ribosomal protein S18 acetylase RimI-like enzyme
LKVLLPEPTEPIERARRLTKMFEAILGIQRQSGEPVLGVIIEGRVTAAAIIEGAGNVSMVSLVLNGLLRLPSMVQGLGWNGTMRGIQFMNELSKNHPPEAHIYLNFLGVDPDYQRHHCGSVLIEELRRLAAERASLCGVYLETATEANVAYYQGRGYEVLGEIRPLGCRMWRMLQRRK